jgi:molybdopterin converting factor small subunit
MITVKFFGLMSVDHNIKKLQLKAGQVSQVLDEIRQHCPNISRQQLLQSVIVVNNRQLNGRKRLTTVLIDGDELVLLGPMCGG